MAAPYEKPRILQSRQLIEGHVRDLGASAIDIVTAGLSGVSSIDHAAAYDIGIRSDGNVGGLCFRYWQPWNGRFSMRFVRIKLDIHIAGRKYLQPVGEKPRLYFIAGTPPDDLANAQLPVFVAEGEKKALSLDRALRQLKVDALVIGIGGVWSWRSSPKELQPDGKLGKGKSRPIEDLDHVVWVQRKVYLVFDSDAATNWKVQAAETALARELERRGARVWIARMPGAA